MKRLLLILLIISVTGCAWFQPKAPPVRLGEKYIKTQLSEYDLAMQIKKFLYAKKMIGDMARGHINNIGGDFFREYNDSVDALADFRAGRIDLWSLENALGDMDDSKRELSTTIKAYLNILMEGTK